MILIVFMSHFTGVLLHFICCILFVAFCIIFVFVAFCAAVDNLQTRFLTFDFRYFWGELTL
jgi:hypothetical protein